MATVKRLTIYAFYDPNGLVDEYVVDCVAAMSEHSDRVLVVSNGVVEASSARRLLAIPSVELVERVNEGFDIWGYKHGLESVGWEKLGGYDEVVLMNSTVAGPLYPLSEMFDAMGSTDFDFWGLTAHAGEDYDPWDLLPTGRLERHIQSYFMAVRRPMLQSSEFREYWESLPLIRSYTDAVALHEAVFTHKFEQLGLRWGCYVDGTDLEAITSYPLMFLPERVLIDKRCPFFKRKALFLAAPDLAATHATSTVAMVECLNTLGYDLRRVLPSVLRTSHQSDVRLSLNTFELIKPAVDENVASLSKVRVVARVKDIESCTVLERFRSVLERCGDFVIVAAHDLDDRVLTRLTAFKARLVTDGSLSRFVREVGRAAQTTDHLLVIGCTGGLTELNAYSCYEAALRAVADSEAALASGVAHLENSILAGALASPLTDIRLGIWAADWREAGVPLAAVLPLLGIEVPLDPAKPAWGPLASVLLAGPGMLAADWDVAADEMSHMRAAKAEALFNSLIPFVLQSHGRLLVSALPEGMTASAVFANHLQQALRALTPKQSTQTKESKPTVRFARVYHNRGAGYLEDEAVVVRPRVNGDGEVTFSWKAPAAVESVRFDPVEGAGVVCRGVTATVDGASVDIVPVNSHRFGAGLDVFMTPDSIYDLRGVKPNATVVVTMEGIDYIEESDFSPRIPEDDDFFSYGGSLTPTLAVIHAELTAMRDAYNAVQDAYEAVLRAMLRNRVRELVARARVRAMVRTRVRGMIARARVRAMLRTRMRRVVAKLRTRAERAFRR